MKVYKFAISYIKKYKGYTLIFVVCSLLLWLDSILEPYILGKLIDILSKQVYNHLVYYAIGGLAAIYTIDIVVTYFQSMSSVKLKTKAGFDLNYYILDHVKYLPLEYFGKVNTTYLNQRINGDSNSIVSFIVSNYVNIFVNSLTFIYIVCFVLKVDFKIGISLFILIPIYIIIYFMFKKPLYKIGYNLKEIQNKFFSKMNEQIYNIRLVKMNVWFDLLGEELIEIFRKLFKYVIKYSRLSYLFSNIDITIDKIASLILFSYGSFEVLNKKMTVGNFIAISSYFSMLLGSISYFANLGKSYQDTLISYNRIKEILNIEVEDNGLEHVNNILQIKFNNVEFSYKNKEIIYDFTYQFKYGKIYCIVGENGSGKSTLINLMIGLLHKYKGNIYYNSIDIRQLDAYWIRKKFIGITEQEPILINDTIKQNITYGLDKVDTNDIYYWCKKFKLYDFINTLPNKFDTIINERSNNISGGEKQKISLVRTFIKNPNVIILDEPTSALDQMSINGLKSILKDLKSNKIIIIVTHDSSLFDISDEILRFPYQCVKHDFKHKEI